MGLGCYKWYQRQTLDGVPARTLSPKGGWTPGGVWTLGSVPVWTLSPEGEGTVRSHINWRGERVPARMLSHERGGLWDLTSVGEENKTLFIRVWKPLPSRRVLKPRQEARKKSLKRTICASGRLGPLHGDYFEGVLISTLSLESTSKRLTFLWTSTLQVFSNVGASNGCQVTRVPKKSLKVISNEREMISDTRPFLTQKFERVENRSILWHPKRTTSKYWPLANIVCFGSLLSLTASRF